MKKIPYCKNCPAMRDVSCGSPSCVAEWIDVPDRIEEATISLEGWNAATKLLLEQETIGTWIPVFLKPTTPQFVIAKKTSTPHILGLYYDSDGKFRYDDMDHTKDVTHWMKLPKK
jgi:hypothetical protein